MTTRRRTLATLFSVCFLVPALAAAQTAAQKPFEPTVGQAGKDVVWVPTPAELVVWIEARRASPVRIRLTRER